jgi:hypothetical protein
MKTVEIYARAGDLAKLAMGRDESRIGRRRGDPPHWKADDDPLAWWCLTEAIVNLREGNPSDKIKKALAR